MCFDLRKPNKISDTGHINIGRDSVTLRLYWPFSKYLFTQVVKRCFMAELFAPERIPTPRSQGTEVMGWSRQLTLIPRSLVSNHRMDSGRSGWMTFLKDATSFAVFVIGVVSGMFWMVVVADMPVFPGYFETERSPVAGLAVIGFVVLLGSIIALWNRRRAGVLLLLAAPVPGVCFAWWQRHGRYHEGLFLTETLLPFALSLLPLAIPGIFWLLTARAGWADTLNSNFVRKRHVQLFAGVGLFASFVLVALVWSLYSPKYRWTECYKGLPPPSVPRFSGQAVFTARSVFVGGRGKWVVPDRGSWGSWSLMRVQRKFWGLPRWIPGFVIVRGYFRVEKMDYLVDGQRSQGLLTHFLPFIDWYPCCYTEPAAYAIADLRVLREGPPKSGVRIIGTVYRDVSGGGGPARNVEVVITGPKGTISTTTDEQGVYDVSGLPEGHYSVKARSADRDGYGHEEQGDVKSGEVWGATLISPTHGLVH